VCLFFFLRLLFFIAVDFVQETLAKATAGVDGMGHVSAIVASAPDNLQSVPDTIDSFPKILKPLEKFNSVATMLADVRASISIL
jgi:hypothetical protein